MSTLHLLHAAHNETTALRSWLAFGDSLLLRESAVILALREPRFHADGVALYVLHADLLARGLQLAEGSHWQVIDDEQFVALSIRHARCVSWPALQA